MKRYFYSYLVLLATSITLILSNMPTDFFIQASFAQARGIRILSPRDGGEITLDQEESMPARREIRGDITGFTRQEIENLRLRVEVSIMTDKWYPQGVARVQSDSTWGLRQAHFGGSDHTIKAVLKDGSGNELTITTIKVTLLQ
jgi:hypothetical protein